MSENDVKALQSVLGFFIILASLIAGANGVHGWGWIAVVGALII